MRSRGRPGSGMRSAPVLLVTVVAVLLAGCGPVAPTPDDGPTFAIAEDFPDPDVVEVDGGYFAYATQGASANIQVASSPDLVSWTVLGTDALPELPGWAVEGDTWAPDVSLRDDGTLVMFYTATDRASGSQCIGVATSRTPEGPFAPVEGAVVCPVDEGGAIDPATFVAADGAAFLLFKNDGNCCGLDTWLSIAPLADDRTGLSGQPTRLIRQDRPWEGRLIEAPTLLERDDSFLLLYSANDYSSLDYAIGYATAPALLGPWTKAAEPVLTTDSSGWRFYGPGGQDVVRGPDGEDRILFHSWDARHEFRGVTVLPLSWKDGRPVVDVPSAVG